MTARFQGLVNLANGRVKISIGKAGVRPVDAVDFRGMAVSPDGLVYGVLDTSQARVFQDGVAIEASTGQVIVSENAVANISMGGLGVDANGAIPYFNDVPGIIHQGVGLKADSKLSVEVQQGAVIPDGFWTIVDPTSCSISNNVITWTRTTADSFIRLAKPGTLVAGQTWVLSYEVLDDSGVGGTDRLFIGGDSCVRPAAQVGTLVQKWSYEVVATDTTFLLNWTPTSTFNNQTLQIRDVRVYDKNNPGAYP